MLDAIRPNQRTRKARNAIRFRQRAVEAFEEAYRCGDERGMEKYRRRAQHWSDKYLRLTRADRD